MLDTSHRVAEQLCPLCRKVLNACTNMTGDEGPVEGDATVCLYCSSVLLFGPNLKLRVATLEELPEEIRPTLRKIVLATMTVKAQRERRT
jgi:hypothetical protein